MVCDYLAGVGSANRVFDGQHVAVLVGQRDHTLTPASIPVDHRGGGISFSCDLLLRLVFLLRRTDLHVLRIVGACGVQLAAAAEIAAALWTEDRA